MFNADRAVRNPELLLMNIGYVLGPAAVLEQIGLPHCKEDGRSVGDLTRSAKLELFRVTELKSHLGLLGAGGRLI